MKKTVSEKSLETIQNLLDVLEDEDLKRLSFLISYKLGGTGKASSDTLQTAGVKKTKTIQSRHTTLLYSALLSEIPDAPALPDSVNLLDPSVVKLLNKSCMALDKVISVEYKGKIFRKVNRLKFYRLFCEMAVAKLNALNAMPTLRQVLGLSQSFYSLLDWAFPECGQGNRTRIETILNTVSRANVTHA